MDPLTHTLVGANLASTRLGTKSRLATAALVIGANLPDIDVLSYVISSDFALGFRRGWTHGALALVVLPFLLTGILLLIDRREAPRARWLLLLSAIAIATHPFLDWLNNYGMRWLMPFDGTWFYGDSVFIMDPWLWLVLGGAWLAGKRPSRSLVFGWAAFALVIVVAVIRRAPGYFPLVLLVAVVLLAALQWKARDSRTAQMSLIALVVASAYIAARIGIHASTLREVRRQLSSASHVIVAPHPFDPTLWDVIALEGANYRVGSYSWRERRVELDSRRLPAAEASTIWATARNDANIRGFVTWARAPWVEGEGARLWIMDARYARERTEGFGGAVVELDQRP